MISETDINTLRQGLLRLELNRNDDLATLHLSRSDHSLLTHAIQFASVANNVIDNANDPLTIRDALSTPNRDDWIAAMREEIVSLRENDTFDLSNTTMPTTIKPLSAKWVFRTKLNADDSVRYKARLVVRGFTQKEGVDFD